MINQFYFPNINVAYSSIPKCACSTIKKTLLYAEVGEQPILKDNPGKVHELVNAYKVHDDKPISNAINLVVVRDPVQRLLSAFLDKFCTAYKNPEAFVTRFISDNSSDLSVINFSEFLDILNKAYVSDKSSLNEHWDDQFKFIADFKEYDIKIDFGSLKSLTEIKYNDLILPVKTIDVHATPKSKTYVRNAHNLSAKELFEYRTKFNNFPSSNSFLSELTIPTRYPNIARQVESYREFLSLD